MNLVTYTKEELEENGFHLKRNLTHEEGTTEFFIAESKELYVKK